MTKRTETSLERTKDNETIEQPRRTGCGITGAINDPTINTNPIYETGKTIHYGEQMPKPHEPIMQYTSQQQLDTSLKEWQERLGLRDWAIVAYLVDVFPENIGASGHCSQNYVAKTAFIRILKYPLSESGADYIKFCSEQTLVHELLHCVLYGSTLTVKNPTVDWVFYEMRTHQELETLSRAFICAKYNITLEWFRV